MKFLLDTNVFREIGKTSPHEHVSAWLAQVESTDPYRLTSIAIWESSQSQIFRRLV